MILSIDVGGSKVLVATFTPEGKKTASIKIKTPQLYSEFIVSLKKAVSELTNGKKPTACCVALPGVINRKDGIVESFGNLSWENIPIVRDLRTFIDCPITIENDAKVAAVAEAELVKNTFSRVLYVTVSTGIGLGLVVDGVLDHNIHDAGGRAIMLEHDGKLQSWEEFASGKALVARTGYLASELEDPAEWYVVARNIALGLTDVIALVDPDVVVIGGGVGAHLDKFKEKLLNELEIFTSKMVRDLPVVQKAKNPEEAVIFGGYLLAKQKGPRK